MVGFPLIRQCLSGAFIRAANVRLMPAHRPWPVRHHDAAIIAAAAALRGNAMLGLHSISGSLMRPECAVNLLKPNEASAPFVIKNILVAQLEKTRRLEGQRQTRIVFFRLDGVHGLARGVELVGQIGLRPFLRRCDERLQFCVVFLSSADSTPPETSTPGLFKTSEFAFAVCEAAESGGNQSVVCYVRPKTGT